MKVIFICGAFRGPTRWDVECNIRVAESKSLDLWALGAAVICPHTNTRYFDKALPDKVWLAGIIELMRRCDAVFALPSCEWSEGAQKELAQASRWGLPILRTIEEVKKWLQS